MSTNQKLVLSARKVQTLRADAFLLYDMWKNGDLGGVEMPEDVDPPLARNSKELLHYLTLGMCLNYQRNAYQLWKACTAGFNDFSSRWIFDPRRVSLASAEDLREPLLRHRIALQPNRHVENWKRVAKGILEYADGDARNLLAMNDYDIGKVRDFIQENKRDFPYLAGPKIRNYWLFVLTQYTDFDFQNRAALSIAPDTHILNASVKLGVLAPFEKATPAHQETVSMRWECILAGSKLTPIDLHTPLWLWSRAGFPPIKGRHD